MDLTHAPIVFLHIPKTAGQTVHNNLSRAVKARRVSPIRVHTQTSVEKDQYPPGYSLYSGHLDWQELGHLPAARFVFTILRDPGERIASFYYYLQRQAADFASPDLHLAQNIGFRRALEWAPDDYFFGGDDAWQTFVRSHYDNFYATYFATRRMLGWGATRQMTESQLLAQARAGLASLDRIYTTDNLPLMEADFRQHFGMNLHLTHQFDNASGEPATSLRWPRLLASFASDAAMRSMKDLLSLDQRLMAGLL